MSNNEKTDIYNSLLDLGCCIRCALRFTSGHDADYENPENSVPQVSNGSDSAEPDLKKRKLTSCCVCLGLLQDIVLNDIVNEKRIEQCCQYDSETFVGFISFPLSLLIREQSMQVFVKEKYPSFYEEHNIVALNKTWSRTIQNKLAVQIKKKFDPKSDFQIKFSAEYDLEEEETKAMNKVKKTGKLSRNNLSEALTEMKAEDFKKLVKVPPDASEKFLTINDMTCVQEGIFIAGRYCKYSRNLGQTPWVLDNVRIIEGSVQEIIFKSLESIFNCKELVFSASGREDFDVRMLGRGRPFFVKINDPKTTKVSFEKFREVENEIKTSKFVEVRHLQFINRNMLSLIKEGEQFKKKTYNALCIVKDPENIQNYIEKINNLSNVVLEQKTPLRVFHRRSSNPRKKEIHSFHACAVPGKNNLFELQVVTQAGTYVKEFVHGDLGRTSPSLGKILGTQIDIVTLDVMDIHLDFPPPVEYK